MFRPRSSRKRGRCQLRTVFGDVEFADDTVTCSAASFAPAVEQLFDDTLRDWNQRRNVGKTERLLVVPNAPRLQVGGSEPVARKLRPFLTKERRCKTLKGSAKKTFPRWT